MEHVDRKKEEENKNYSITYTIDEDENAYLHFTFEDENRAKTVASFLSHQMKSIPIQLYRNRITIPPSSEKNPIGAVFVRENDAEYIDVNFGSNQSRGAFQILMNTDDKSSRFKVGNSENFKEDSIRFNKKLIEENYTFQPPEKISANQQADIKNNVMSKQMQIVQEVEKKLDELGAMTDNSDEILQDKHDVLWGIKNYLEDRIDIYKLSLIVDRCTKYDVQRGYFNPSSTARLLTKAVSEKTGGKQTLPPAVTEFIETAEDIRNKSPDHLYSNSKIEVGSSGYFYIDGALHRNSSMLYPDKTKAQAVADHAMKMMEKKKQLYKDGGYKNGRWTKASDNMYRDKDKVLSAAIWFSLGELDITQLALKADLFKQYDFAWVGKSETEKMIDTVLTARNMKMKDLEVNEEFYNKNKSDYNPVAELKEKVLQGDLNALSLGFHQISIEAGKSGYIYVNGQLSSFINDAYEKKENRIECAAICKEIQDKLLKLAKDGGYQRGEWTKDPDHKYRHKFEVLSMTMGYLMGGVSITQLSLVGDKCKNYDENWAGRFGRSDTGKLLDRALVLKGETEHNKLLQIHKVVIDDALPPQENKVNTHSFFKREKGELGEKIREKKAMENLGIEAGESGYIYIDSRPSKQLHGVYTAPEKAQECVALCKDIQEELKKLRKSAGDNWENDIEVDEEKGKKEGLPNIPEDKTEDKTEGKSEDESRVEVKEKQKGGIYYHKYRVLLKTMEFILGETTADQLEATLENYPKYNEKRIKISTSTTEDLLDRAIKLTSMNIDKHPKHLI